jgi:tellurite resistance protein
MSETHASPSREELSPLFTDVSMSVDDANAIVAALRDIAETDGVHEQELGMIAGFVEALDADLGAAVPTLLEPMTPAKLASQLIDPTLRTVAVQCAVLLALADGAISDKERARVTAYASALGVTGESYTKIERVMTKWVKSGDIATIF